MRKGSGSSIPSSVASFVAILAFAALAPTIAAQDDSADFDESQVLRPGTGRLTTIEIGEDEAVLAALDGIALQYGDLEMRADAAVLWTGVRFPEGTAGSDEDPLHTGAQIPPAAGRPPLGPPLRNTPRGQLASQLREIYLEGHVLWRRGDGQTVFAERLYFDLIENRGVLVEGTLLAEQSEADGGRTWSLQVRAERIRALDPTQLVVENAVFSTCTFGEPHYHLETERLSLRLEGDDALGAESLRSAHVEAQGSAFHAGPLPGLPLPPFSFTATQTDSIPLRRIGVGRSSAMGVYLRSLWGTEFEGAGTAVHEAIGLDAPFQGDFELNLDGYSRRGPALGPRVQYRSDGLYFGEIDTYVVHDRADEDHTRLDRAQPGGLGDPLRFDVNHPQRGRARTQNRFFLSDSLRFDAEAYYLSDEGFLREYFESDFEEDKEPESYGHLVFQDGTLRARGLYRNRLNDFDTQTDSLPRFSLDQVAFPVFALPWSDQPTHLLVEHSTELSNLRRHPAEEVLLGSDRIARADSVLELSTPFDLGPFGLRPFAAGALTAWDETAPELDGSAGEGLGRAQSAVGARLQLPFHRDYAAHLPALSIDGLRHVVTADVGYENLWLSTRDPNELVVLDEVDERAKLERFLVGLRQRLSTWRGNRVDSFLDLDVQVPLYPDEDRDNPVRTDLQGQPVGRTAGPLEFDLRYAPGFTAEWLRRTSLRVEGEWDLQEGHLRAFETALRVAPARDWTTLVSYRVQRGFSRIFTAGFDWRITEKWALGAFEQIDLRRNDRLEERAVLRRYGHDFLFELHFERDHADRNTSVSVNLAPIFSRLTGRDRRAESSPGLGMDEF